MRSIFLLAYSLALIKHLLYNSSIRDSLKYSDAQVEGIAGSITSSTRELAPCLPKNVSSSLALRNVDTD
ncbi:hypothetical protein Zmor_001165 [Zophobas morio]|uniref:Uncharacterized protein n=1 Tax=Zophobas morio TaxID=2755281 RepID=A0AA38MS30_9CUCU|nr:hypothetical protein Zmor_001165 [Zophobas morio]